MVRFGERLGEEQVPDWRYAYLNYESLKEQIDLIEEVKQKKENFNIAKLMFQRHVDAEITNIVDFYEVKLQCVQQKILNLQQRKIKLGYLLKDYMKTNNEKLVAINEELQLWRQVAIVVKNLMDFVALNLAGIRKIEKKFIKNFGEVDPVKGISASMEISHPHEEQQLFVASFLQSEIIDGLQKMRKMQELQEAKNIIARTMACLHGRRIYLSGEDESVATEINQQIQKQLSGNYRHLSAFASQSFDSNLEAQQQVEQIDKGGQHASLPDVQEEEEDEEVEQAWEDLIVQCKAQRSLLRTASHDTHDALLPTLQDYESVIKEMVDAERRAHKETRLYQLNDYLAAQAGIFTPAPTKETAVATTLGLTLNLVSVLLQLGQPASTGGLIVGFADITAMLAAFIYSGWTNKHFKIPLIASCFVLMASNILFSISYDIKNKNAGLAVLLIARLLTGLGAARSLNRRYIADFVSIENRTKASAGFVAASAAGMSLGPLLSLPLSAIPTKKYDIGHGSHITINDVTLGGYLMFVLWVIFCVIVILFFKEPKEKYNEVIIQKSIRESGDDEDDVHVPLLQNGANTEIFEEGQEGDDFEQANKPVDVENVLNVQNQPKYNMFRDPAIISVLLCILMLFMLKLVQQGTISSTPIFETPLTFNRWHAAEVGLYLALANLGMLPANFLVAAMSPYISDRMIMFGSILTIFVGCSALLTTPWLLFPLTMARYLIGTIPVLIATLSLECVSMSLMSKKISPQMARGTLNAGLLSTIGGSVGRFLGNVGITLLGSIASWMSGHPLIAVTDQRQDLENAIQGVTYFANLIFGIFDVCAVVCIVLYFVTFKQLATKKD